MKLLLPCSMLLLLLAAALAGPPAVAQTDGAQGDPNHSPLLAQNQSWQTDFPREGTVWYHCMPHDAMPGMNAKVIVSSSDPRAVERATVAIRNHTFEPREVVVKPGGFVNWTNFDAVAHDVMLTRFEPMEESSGPGGSAIPGPSLLALLAGVAAAGLLTLARRR